MVFILNERVEVKWCRSDVWKALKGKNEIILREFYEREKNKAR